MDGEKALAEKLATSQGTVGPWFTGEGAPSAELLTRLPSVLGVSAHWLLTGHPPVEPPGEPPDVRRAYELGWFSAISALRAAIEDLEITTAEDYDEAVRALRRLRAGNAADDTQKQPKRRRG